jgi:hypothetical protein
MSSNSINVVGFWLSVKVIFPASEKVYDYYSRLTSSPKKKETKELAKNDHYDSKE